MLRFHVPCFRSGHETSKRSRRVASRRRPTFESLEDRIVFSHAYLLIADDGVDLSSRWETEVAAAGGVVTANIAQIGVAVASSNDPDFAARMAEVAGVQSVVRDLPVFSQARVASGRIDASLAPTTNSPAADVDPLSFLQWGLDAIHAPEAWGLGAAGAGVRVAVLDSGIVADHPDIAPNLNTALSTSFSDFNHDGVVDEWFEFIPSEVNGGFSHSTHVAGIIAGADNDFGIIGVAPQAELVAVKILSDTVFDDVHGFIGQLAQGITYAASIDVDVINMSVVGTLPKDGGFTNPGNFLVTRQEVRDFTRVLQRAVNFAHSQGAVIIAAGGNSATDFDERKDLITLPRDLNHVISVSATGPRGLGIDPDADVDVPAFYTDHGRVIDIAAPGGNLDFDLLASGELCANDIPCFLYDTSFSANSAEMGGFSFAIGTSFAAPHVAGAAALLIGQNGGEMNPNNVRKLLFRTAEDLGEPGRDAFYGHGRLDAFAALSALIEQQNDKDDDDEDRDEHFEDDDDERNHRTRLGRGARDARVDADRDQALSRRSMGRHDGFDNGDRSAWSQLSTASRRIAEESLLDRALSNLDLSWLDGTWFLPDLD